MRTVYADNAATTKMSKTAVAAMLPMLEEFYGNPSSLHTTGQIVKEKLDEARADIAKCLNAEPNEIYFTSCGTESDNLAIRTAAELGAKKGKKHIVTTAFEHHAVLHTVKKLEKQGFTVTYLPVSAHNGVLDASEVEAAIREDTALVTIMFANNEIGTIQPIEEIGRICREKKVLFHTDAVQAAGHLPIDVKKQNIDMLSLSAHKFHGPKGVGVLYAKRGVRLVNLMEGGAQEKGKRPGTENMAGIVAMAAAFKESCANMQEVSVRLTALRNKLIDGLSAIPHSALNGDREKRLPGNVNFSFEGIEGESLLLYLDDVGIEVSSGSACASASLDPSHVLLAIGVHREVAHGSVRISLGEDATEEDVDYILEKLPPIVADLREISPVWDALEKGTMTHRI